MRVVILGTGTDVGKSYVTACVARGLREHGRVRALKPIESGVGPGTTGDAGLIAEAAGHPPLLSPWRFERAVSPHLAARESGLRIDLDAVTRWITQEEQRSAPGWVLIELAGGAFSPLAPSLANVDLALALEPALWLVVAPDGLGVLHDVSALLKALPRAPDAIVLSGARVADQSTGLNARELERLGLADVLEVVPAGAQAAPATVRWLLGHPMSVGS